MSQIVEIPDYASFTAYTNTITDDKEVIMFFYGKKGSNGVSWCSHCAEAESHVMNAYKKLGQTSILLVIDVGTKEQWTDLKNPYRVDTTVHITDIPTLLRWKNVQRLETGQCAKDDLLELFFENKKK